MREFKFRAWDKENGCFFKDTNRAYENVLEQMFISPSGDISIRRMDGMYHESLFPDRFVLQQYTGFKNVYEGDVLNCLYPERGEHGDIIEYLNYKGVVLWDEKTYKFVLKCNLGNEYLEHLLRPSVIGNIYENPELLEVNHE